MNQFELLPTQTAAAANLLIQQCYGLAKASGWHTDLKTGLPKVHNRPERLMLIVSELAEAMEGVRKNRMDDHLPQYPMHAVELADAVIRCMDEAGDCGYDLGEIIAAKLAYNANRADHKPENRALENGKKF